MVTTLKIIETLLRKIIKQEKDIRDIIKPELRDIIDLTPVTLQPDKKYFDRNKLNIHWVISDFTNGSGGHMTIFRVVRLLELFGHKNTIWIFNQRQHEQSEKAYFDMVKDYQLCSAEVRFSDEGLSKATGDVVVATNWNSVSHTNTTRNFKRRFYFVQDYEPYFHPYGSLSLSAKRTYYEDMEMPDYRS